MPRLTVLAGVLLVVLGAGAYVGSGFESPTAALPAVLGIPVAVLGRLAAEERRRATAMHAAAILTLVGFLGGLQGVVQLPELLAGGDVERPLAAAVQSIMTVICAVHLVFAVQSFRAARQAPAAE
jgi:hypothetical protein